MEDSLPPMAMMVDTRPSLRQEKQLNVDFRITFPTDSLIEPESGGCVFWVVCRQPLPYRITEGLPLIRVLARDSVGADNCRAYRRFSTRNHK